VDGEIVETTLPHSDFGDAECCGCLNGIIQGHEAKIVCNECGVIVRTVEATDLQRTLDEMETTSMSLAKYARTADRSTCFRGSAGCWRSSVSIAASPHGPKTTHSAAPTTN
jgi:ribosomal protein S27E